MSLIQQRTPISHEEEFKYAKLAMEWVRRSASASFWWRWRRQPCWCASPSTAFKPAADDSPQRRAKGDAGGLSGCRRRLPLGMIFSQFRTENRDAPLLELLRRR